MNIYLSIVSHLAFVFSWTRDEWSFFFFISELEKRKCQLGTIDNFSCCQFENDKEN